MRYDYTHNGVTRTVSRPSTGCLFLDGISIPAGASDEYLATLGLTPHIDPPPPAPVDPQTLKSLNLKASENAFILFCRSVGLSDKASSSDFDTLTAGLIAAGSKDEAIMIAVKALALINDVTQNDGKWSDIAWHQEIVEA